MLNAIPFFGWFLSFIFTVSLAVPFWIIWTVCGIGETYFYFVPKVYHGIGFWASVGLFMVIGILKAVLVPKFVSVSNTSGSK
jgi:hypothetical protein